MDSKIKEMRKAVKLMYIAWMEADMYFRSPDKRGVAMGYLEKRMRGGVYESRGN